MDLAQEIRARREARKWSQKKLAVAVGTSQPTIDRIERGITQHSAYHLPIIAELAIPIEALEPSVVQILRTLAEVAPNASAPFEAPELPLRQIPVYGVAVGGDDGRMKFNGERLDMVGCPPQLEKVYGAYAVYVAGDSMVPSFKPGQLAWVHPHRTAKPGDDVIVQLHPEHEDEAPEGFIKELVKLTPNSVVVRQYNPAKDIEFPRSMVKSLHVVVFASRA